MKNILYLIVCTLIISSCTSEMQKSAIGNQADYQVYLNQPESSIDHLTDQLTFWQKKVEIEPRGFIFYEKLGGTYHQLFEKTGDVNFLNKADSSFAIAAQMTQGKWKVSSLLNLSSLAIKKHDFQNAAEFAVQAKALTNQKLGPLLMQFDAEMELGNYQMSKAILDQNVDMNSFDYLVRLSKYKDHEGDLDAAIFYMEEAESLVKKHETSRKLWANANLADMYGHAGRIEDSYRKYLAVLSEDSTYDYALKGIAWILYSNDQNPTEAKKIIKALQKKTALPDYYLFLAEISDFEKRSYQSNAYKQLFLIEASKPLYEGMYNKYLIDIFIERGDFASAEKLAQEEVTKRPSPATHDWLAWTLFHQGKQEEAVRIYQENVEDQTFEPEAVYHMGVVYHAMNEDSGLAYLKESLEASYELGPIVEKDILSRLNASI